MKGEPKRFIKGHNRRSTKPEYVVQGAGYLTPCWLWQRNKTPAGYGQRASSVEGDMLAHRAYYVAANGPIPSGLVLDHLCRNPACVNPEHLEAVTERENILRGNGMSARNARKTHCKRGHPFDEANTYVNPNKNQRLCRTCQREWGRRRARSMADGSAGAAPNAPERRGAPQHFQRRTAA